jgi:tetratricopeptide (TPR) repeat protein
MMTNSDILGTIVKNLGTGVAVLLNVYFFVTGRKSLKKEKEDTEEIERLTSQKNPSRRAKIQHQHKGMTIKLIAVSLVLVLVVIGAANLDEHYLTLFWEALKEGNIEEASAYLTKAIAENSDNPEIVKAYIGLGDKTSKSADVKIKPVEEESPFMITLAESFESVESPEDNHAITALTEALVYYEKAREIDPGNTEVSLKIESTRRELTQRLEQLDQSGQF